MKGFLNHYLIMELVVHEVSQGDSYDYTFTGRKRSSESDIFEPVRSVMPKYGSKKPTKGRKPYRKPRGAKPDRNFVKKVKAIIAKDVETKEAFVEYALNTFNGPVNNVADTIKVMPNIFQGTDNGQRIGDNVKLQKMSFKGHMQINVVPNTTGTTIPTAIPNHTRFLVRAFVFSLKRFNNYSDAAATTAWMSQFLKKGNTTQGLDGTVTSMYLPVNTDVITVHKEWLEDLTIPAIYAQTATATGFSNTAVGFENTYKFLMADFKINRKLGYDDTSAEPENFAPLFCLSYCKLDASSSDIIVSKVSCAFVCNAFYEDA